MIIFMSGLIHENANQLLYYTHIYTKAMMTYLQNNYKFPSDFNK